MAIQLKNIFPIFSVILFFHFSLNAQITTWNLAGNASTTPPSQYIGTSDAQPLVFKTNGNEYMRILTSGNVGIGTSSPSTYSGYTTLALSGSTGAEIDFQAGATRKFAIYNDASKLCFYNFNTASNAITVENTAGKVGIGTNTPTTKLHISGDANAVDLLKLQNTNTTYPRAFRIGPGAGAGNIFGIYDDSAHLTRIAIDYNGNVGIGTVSPIAKLQVTNGTVIAEGTTGTLSISGAGNRMMWVPYKAAFRAGNVTGTAWDSVNIGGGSVAFGSDTKASGGLSFAVGGLNVASGNFSIATGVFSSATGDASFSGGLGTVASGYYSVALGYYTKASALNSMAIGDSTIASGSYSFCSGGGTSASGAYTNAFGLNTTAKAYNSFVLGRYNVVAGDSGSWTATDPLFVIGNGSGTGSSRSNAVTVLKNGKTLIGNPGLANFKGTPDGYLLFVQQGILTEKVKVAVDTTTNWADFVFDEKYKLKSITELETFVKANKHLPNVPSAQDVVNNGIDVATMDARLLEKIEELSLYIIQQQKEMEEMKREMKGLQEKIIR